MCPAGICLIGLHRDADKFSNVLVIRSDVTYVYTFINIFTVPPVIVPFCKMD